MKKIAVASGKGGTGKTTFSLILTKILSKKFKVELVDCDVEEPNCHLFLDFDEKKAKKTEIDVFSPEIDYDRCDYCRKCVDACKFNALILIGKRFIKFDELCHPCKACVFACPRDAVKEGRRSVGFGYETILSENLFFSFAKMTVMESRAIPLIQEIKNNIRNDVDYVIFDAPPGASCPFVEVIKDADKVFLITEPTPFGLYDLRIAYEVAKELKRDVSIVINKSNENDGIIEEFARKHSANIVLKIPFSKEFAQKYSKGEIDEDVLENLEGKILKLLQ